MSKITHKQAKELSNKLIHNKEQNSDIKNIGLELNTYITQQEKLSKVHKEMASVCLFSWHVEALGFEKSNRFIDDIVKELKELEDE